MRIAVSLARLGVDGLRPEVSDGDFTAKDFRTWNGTVLAARYLRLCEPCTSIRMGRKHVTQAIKRVAEDLRNTPATKDSSKLLRRSA